MFFRFVTLCLFTLAMKADFIDPVEGKRISGVLTFKGSQVSIAGKDYDLKNISSFERQVPMIPNLGEFLLLTDGSVIACQIKNLDTATGELLFQRGETDYKIHADKVYGISFNGSQYPEVPEGDGHRLVMNNGQVTEGKIAYFTNTMLGFGDVSPVRYRKDAVNALIFRAQSKNNENKEVVLYTTGREVFSGRLVKNENGQISLNTPIGELTFLLNRLVRLELYSSSFVSLSNLKIGSSHTVPYIGTALPPAINRSFTGANIYLRQLPVKHFISLHTKTQINYELPEKTKNFRTELMFDPASSHGDLVFTIQGDGKALFNERVNASNTPLSLNIPLTGVRKLTIIADFGERGSSGDFLILARPELIKEAK